MSLIATLPNKVPRESKAGVGEGLKGWSDRQTERENHGSRKRERKLGSWLLEKDRDHFSLQGQRGRGAT